MTAALAAVGLVALAMCVWVIDGLRLHSRIAARASLRVGEHDFKRAVLTAAEDLPFGWAHALWLVDTCRCSYAEGALEVGIGRRAFARRVRLGRDAIRARIEEPSSRWLLPRERALRRSATEAPR